MSGRRELARELLLQAEASLANAEHRRALGLLKAALSTDRSQALAHRVNAVASSLDAANTGSLPVRVAFLSDHLIGPVPQVLKAHALLSDLMVESFVPSFDSWQQEIAEASSKLYSFDPDVVILDLRLERLAPDFAHAFLSLSAQQVSLETSRLVGVVMNAVDRIRARSRARLIIHSFERPGHPVLGIYDRVASAGQLGTAEHLNEQLRNAAAQRTDAHVLDLDVVAADVGTSAFFDRRMYALAKLPYSSVGIARLAVEYAKYLRAFFGKTKKVLVLDADNTLWGGIVGEDGLDGIRLDEDSGAAGHLEFQRYVAELGRKGVVLALNSSNERADVLEVFAMRREMVLRQEDFAIIVANWKDKAENLLEIARELDLGIDSFVFVDDDPAQCARVRAALPDVAVVELTGEPFGFVPVLAHVGWFDTLTLTEEDRRRNALYRASAARHELEEVSTSQADFVGSLQVQVHVTRLAPGGIARAAALTQRTNQFNLTTRRYSEDDLRGMLSDPVWSAFTVRLVDRFGDIGVIGLVMTRRDGASAVIDTFLMSCRALRRFVEDAMLAVAVSQALRAGAREVVGVHIPTKKNGQTADFYPDHGFTPTGPNPGGERRWVRTEPLPVPAAVTVIHEGDEW